MSRRRRQPQVYTCEHCGQNFGTRAGHQVHLNKPTCPVLREQQAAETPAPEPAKEAHHNRWRQRMQFANGGIAWEPRRSADE